MTDRELLENAAKAAGIDIYESTDGTIQNRPVWVFRAGGGMGTMPYEEQWDPLREDAQAFRLAVKLGISVHLDLGNRIVVAEPPLFYRVGNEEIHYDESKFGGGCDPYAATRRAIVRAAAEIGKSMV